MGCSWIRLSTMMVTACYSNTFDVGILVTWDPIGHTQGHAVIKRHLSSFMGVFDLGA